MGQILLGTATTTHATKTKIQTSEANVHMIEELRTSIQKRHKNGRIMIRLMPLKYGHKPGRDSVLTADAETPVLSKPGAKSLLPLDDRYNQLRLLILALTHSITP